MQRLEFSLPEWTRYIWVSAEARTVWEPRITAIVKAFKEAEVDLVLHDKRIMALQFVLPSELPAYTIRMLQKGLSVIPVNQEGGDSSNGGYISATQVFNPDQPWSYRVLVCKVGEEQPIFDLLNEYNWNKDNGRKGGEFLGYPSCCVNFYEATWFGRGIKDTTWLAAEDAWLSQGNTDTASTLIEFNDLDPHNNMLLRWTGVRPVPFLPCSFSCENTRKFSKEIFGVMDSEVVSWLMEMLSWNVQWSALHGIAEIKTPVFKVSTSTDATGVEYLIKLHGSSYPREGASGLDFPYKNESHVQLTQTRSFNSVSYELEDWYYTDNGFTSFDVMANCHRPLLSILKDLDYSNIVDLGCGNGALLSKAVRGRSHIKMYGCDNRVEVIEHSRLVHKDSNGFQALEIGSFCGLMQETNFDIALCGINRFVELREEPNPPDSLKHNLLPFLRNNCKKVIFYAYAHQVEDKSVVNTMNKMGLGDFTILKVADNFDVPEIDIASACLVTMP